MPQTIRKYWGALPHGRNSLNLNWPAVDQDSVVVVTASECNAQHVRFIGAASLTVANIAPHGPPFDGNHGVTFVVNVDWSGPINVVTDITLLDRKPIDTQIYVPPTPPNVGLRMQYQEANQWCWIAVATSINHFYDPVSSWTQCKVMTAVGQKINGFASNTSGCPSAATLQNHTELGPIIANPYDKKAEYILNNSAYGIDTQYIKSGGVSDPLKQMGNWASNQPKSLTLAQITSEINAGRPIAVDITWNSGGSHVVAIAGVQGDTLLILDPANGTSVVSFTSFPGTYFSGAVLDGYTFTKKA